ncbi:MAG: tripartite tricarboxylate transporter permease, partial [Rhizobium rhizophilum]
LLFCCIGVYSMNNRVFDVVLAAGFGLLGYIFRKARCEPGPLLLGFVLGPLLEANLRRTLLITQGDPSIFVERPISLTMLVATVVLLALMMLPSFRTTRQEAFKEEET